MEGILIKTNTSSPAWSNPFVPFLQVYSCQRYRKRQEYPEIRLDIDNLRSHLWFTPSYPSAVVVHTNPSPHPEGDPSRPGLGKVSGIFINVHSQSSPSQLFLCVCVFLINRREKKKKGRKNWGKS